jgi:hypothetical protein
MSVDFYPLNKQIRMTDVFDGRLEKHGVREEQTENTTSTARCLTDGENFVWAFGSDDDPVSFTRYAGNYPIPILAAIRAEFDVELGGVDDIDPRTARPMALMRAIFKLVDKDFADYSDEEIFLAVQYLIARLPNGPDMAERPVWPATSEKDLTP